MNKKIRIIIAEHGELLRASLVTILNSRPEFEIVGEARNGKELLAQLKHKEADIALMDVEMPVMDGRATLKIMQVRFPDVKIIILSNHTPNHNYTSEFMSQGARCYLTIQCRVETLLTAIDEVDREGYYFDNSISKAMLGALNDKPKDVTLNNLVFTDRETEIMKAVCDGQTNKQIALSMNLSRSSVDFYKQKIYEKSNCHNNASLVKFAFKQGIIPLSQTG